MSKILIVDDHSDIRRLIRITLDNSFEVYEAEDGASGLAAARAYRPDLVILDVMMPGGLDGFQVLEQIRADRSLDGTRVIMLTARAQQRDRDMGASRGADAYFIKPFSPLRLVAAIKETLEK